MITPKIIPFLLGSNEMKDLSNFYYSTIACNWFLIKKKKKEKLFALYLWCIITWWKINSIFAVSVCEGTECECKSTEGPKTFSCSFIPLSNIPAMSFFSNTNHIISSTSIGHRCISWNSVTPDHPILPVFLTEDFLRSICPELNKQHCFAVQRLCTNFSTSRSLKIAISSCCYKSLHHPGKFRM